MSGEPIPISLENAWRVRNGNRRDHPGYFPGSPEESAYLAAEEERRARAYAAMQAAPDDTSLMDDLRSAWRHHAGIELERSIQRRFDRCCHGKRR